MLWLVEAQILFVQWDILQFLDLQMLHLATVQVAGYLSQEVACGRVVFSESPLDWC